MRVPPGSGPPGRRSPRRVRRWGWPGCPARRRVLPCRWARSCGCSCSCPSSSCPSAWSTVCVGGRRGAVRCARVAPVYGRARGLGGLVGGGGLGGRWRLGRPVRSRGHRALFGGVAAGRSRCRAFSRRRRAVVGRRRGGVGRRRAGGRRACAVGGRRSRVGPGRGAVRRAAGRRRGRSGRGGRVSRGRVRAGDAWRARGRSRGLGVRGPRRRRARPRGLGAGRHRDHLGLRVRSRPHGGRADEDDHDGQAGLEILAQQLLELVSGHGARSCPSVLPGGIGVVGAFGGLDDDEPSAVRLPGRARRGRVRARPSAARQARRSSC